jgi:hypothetical protein
MRSESDRKSRQRASPGGAGYRSPRTPRLRAGGAGSPASEPAREATGRSGPDSGPFPELGEEAIVTIVEIDPVAALAAGEGAASRTRPAAPRRSAASRASESPLEDDELPPGMEEAIVEIVELPLNSAAPRRKSDNRT